MERAVIFDLYDTILKDISFDFSRGLKYLYDTYFSQSCTLKELQEYADTFLPMYTQRKIDYHEVCLCKDEIQSSTMVKENKDIIYVGNDYMTDVMGPTSMGLKTVWYNKNHLPNKENLLIYDIDDFRRLLEIVE